MKHNVPHPPGTEYCPRRKAWRAKCRRGGQTLKGDWTRNPDSAHYAYLEFVRTGVRLPKSPPERVLPPGIQAHPKRPLWRGRLRLGAGLRWQGPWRPDIDTAVEDLRKQKEALK